MFKTLLLTVDVNDLKGSEKPAEAARHMALDYGAELHVMNVVPDYGMSIVGAYFSKDHNKAILKEAKAALESWAQQTLKDVPDLRLHVDQGTVYDLVLKEAEAVKADAIIVGAHKSQLKDYLIGPNAARISRHAKQSVFVIR
ncbi:universal stress protein [Shimia sp. R11_0]|uniref:Universal stress protein F n=1 Tax=Shimia marina TaxID=321267 RepID=A0A0P1ETZ9_9RHOB|nr:MULTISPECIES: universal stress protein [Shimia]MBO9476594.1 universal stress protein [Shimia sp. R11_0]CUH53981.1 Universal stress protein F [Shimia marina]SFE17708.1 Nucleotide-binding universal stress protein, UspA family [Shimia marina]